MQLLPLCALESMWIENDFESSGTPTGGAGRLQEPKALPGCCLDMSFSPSLWDWRSLLFCPTTTGGGRNSSRQQVERLPPQKTASSSDSSTLLGAGGHSPSSSLEVSKQSPPPQTTPCMVPQTSLPSWEMSFWVLKEKTLSRAWLLQASEAWRSDVERCRCALEAAAREVEAA
eukprot:TRINITY_DN21476_c0_g1_i1.p1 TRINITY_DN21476_c0_g1~~TRINITY_DN21476_c0_g1_i1.p1  ORF type:complete len:173 (+),score=42.36 TRINITY_DN21476_c0_g1_i1:109-627(+)